MSEKVSWRSCPAGSWTPSSGAQEKKLTNVGITRGYGNADCEKTQSKDKQLGRTSLRAGEPTQVHENVGSQRRVGEEGLGDPWGSAVMFGVVGRASGGTGTSKEHRGTLGQMRQK